MKVELRNGLTGSRAVVEPDVEGVRRQLQIGGQVLLAPVDPSKQPSFFSRGELLEPGDGSANDDERVAEGNRQFTLKLTKPVTFFTVYVIGVPASGDNPHRAFSSRAELQVFSE